MNIRLQKLFLVLTIVFLSVAAFAADKIEGAFGKKFGDAFDTNSAIRVLGEKDGMKNGILAYQFNPTDKFRSFKNYFVQVTPKTHKVYSMWAVVKISDIGGLRAARNEQTKIMELLEKQFGNDETNEITDIKIQQGNRVVATKLTGSANGVIAILYSDSDLKALADKERLTAK